MRSALKITLVLFFFAASAPTFAAEKNACGFLSKVKSIFAPKTKFNDARFLESKAKFIEAIKNKTPIDLKTVISPTDRLALLDAANSMIPANPMNLEEFFKTATIKQKKAAYRIMKSFDFRSQRFLTQGGGFSLTKLQVRAEDLYRLVNSDGHPSFKKWIGNYTSSYLPEIGANADALMRHRVETAVLNKNIPEALKDLNVIRTPSAIEHFRRWNLEHRVLRQAIIGKSVDAVLAYYTGAWGLLLRPVPLKLLAIKNELIEKAAQFGYESIQKDLAQVPERLGYGISAAKAEAALNYGRRMYIRGFTAYTAYYVVTNWNDIKTKAIVGAELIKGAYQMMRMTPKTLQEYEDATYNLEEAQLSQIKSSFEGTLAFNHPLLPEDIWQSSAQLLRQGPDILFNSYNSQGAKKKVQLIKQYHPGALTDDEINTACLTTLREMRDRRAEEEDEGIHFDPKIVADYESWVRVNHPNAQDLKKQVYVPIITDFGEEVSKWKHQDLKKNKK